MGIPSYFSYIIKNHSKIIKSLRGLGDTRFDILLMDCNSIVYDAVRDLEASTTYNPAFKPDFEKKLISNVIDNIHAIIKTIQPSKYVYIAFDGVAPFAKMNQQRTRRYKSSFLATLDFERGVRIPSSQYIPKSWNTASITPGTEFMEQLSHSLARAFSLPLPGTQRTIVSASNEPGEGEHKMFAYLRENAHKHDQVAVYGLDSDLIMLSIFHKPLVYNIHIFREAPSFSKTLFPSYMKIQPNEPLFINTHMLTKCILQEMGCGHTYTLGRVYDYIFMCFMLGNDFLPHFLALNLRTTGLDILMGVYAKHISPFVDRGFIDPVSLNIQWKWVQLFFAVLAKDEHAIIKDEFQKRDQLASATVSRNTSGLNCDIPTTAKDRQVLFENTPILLRGDELYIAPEMEGWEHRYYGMALHCEYNSQNAQRVCTNYLEGLEWVFKYYTSGCPHWAWTYKHHYPPLLADLAKYTPPHNKDWLDAWKIIPSVPCAPLVQLAYVIPKMQFGLLPEKLGKHLAKYDAYYPEMENVEFQWMGCRYFWEAHAILPNIPMVVLTSCCSEPHRSV